VWFDYDNSDTPSVGGDETYQWSGDSGAPTFTPFEGRLTVLGVHWAITQGNPLLIEGDSSIDSFLPEYITGMNGVLSAKGQTITAVPELSTVHMLLVGLVLGSLLSRSKLRG